MLADALPSMPQAMFDARFRSNSRMYSSADSGHTWEGVALFALCVTGGCGIKGEQVSAGWAGFCSTGAHDGLDM